MRTKVETSLHITTSIAIKYGLASIGLISVLMVLGENVSALSPSFPLGARPPVGACQSTRNHRRWARARRPRIRNCLRKGCRRRYQARSWNQRYCQEPECLRQVRRWQAARRQAKRRRDGVVLRPQSGRIWRYDYIRFQHPWRDPDHRVGDIHPDPNSRRRCRRAEADSRLDSAVVCRAARCRSPGKALGPPALRGLRPCSK